MDYKILGRNIQSERINRKMTQKQLAACVHVTPSYIGQIERGERNVSLDILVQIANALNTPVDFLIEYTYSNPLKRRVLYHEIIKILEKYSTKELSLFLKISKDLDTYIDKN